MKISAIGKENSQSKETHKSKNPKAKLAVNHLELLIKSHNENLKKMDEIDSRIREKLNAKKKIN